MSLLKKGSKGSKVEDLQKMLNKAKAKPTLTPDGDFGKNTEKAVKYFQKQKGLTVDGLVGENTLGALKKASGGPGGSGGGGSGSGGGKGPSAAELETRFKALYQRMRKQLISDGNRMFLMVEQMEPAAASCKRIGTDHFLKMIPKIEKLLTSAKNIVRKHSGFAKLLDEDAKLFVKELRSDPAKAKKRFLVVENKEKQIAELRGEFQAAVKPWPPMRDEIKDALKGKGAKDDPSKPSNADPKLVKAFETLYARMRKETRSNAHRFFITLQGIKYAPGTARHLGTEHFLDMIPKFEEMLKHGVKVAKKNTTFLELLEEDNDLFHEEVESDPAKAKKRLLVMKNKEKQIAEIDAEFEAIVGPYREMSREMMDAKKKKREAGAA